MMFDVDCPNTPDGNSPKATPHRPPSMTRRIQASSRSNNSKFTPRIRSSTSYDHGPRGSYNNRERATSYDGRGGLEPEGSTQLTRAPSSGPGLYRASPSYERGSASHNPFDDDKSLVRGRTHSDSWWKEEIVNERDDKREVLDGYYGLSQKGE
jgi:hypothetical protein